MKNCTACVLSKSRRKMVRMRGAEKGRVDVLLIGEAPGETEDVLGKPFVGPSGKLLTKLLDTAERIAEVGKLRYAITNTVACRPCDDRHAPNRPPTKAEVEACRPRLLAEVKQADPFRVILVGAIARDALGKMFPTALKIVHPAFILRNGGMGSPYFKAAARDLAAFLERIANEKARVEKQEDPRRSKSLPHRVCGTDGRRGDAKPTVLVVRVPRRRHVLSGRVAKCAGE